MSYSKFRPCIDLHHGQVKQIVGGTLDSDNLQTNFVSPHPASHYAQLYRQHQLLGGHVIQLGPDNQQAALSALEAWPHHLQVGGGITHNNARRWIEQGASKVIVTSWLFPDNRFSLDRLRQLSSAVGGREHLVVDLSCRSTDKGWVVAMDRWQTLTDLALGPEILQEMAEFCSEFLVHAADVEGLCRGIDQELVRKLAEWSPIPVTYAGGASSIKDLELVSQLSNGKVDLTVGSALDIFGGSKIKFLDCIKWNQAGKQ